MSSIRQHPGRTALLSFALVASLSGVLGLLGAQNPGSAVGQETKAEVGASHAKELSKAFRAAAESTTPTVVRIQSKTNVKPVKSSGSDKLGGKRENPFKGTPFEEFFGRGMPEGFDFDGHDRMPRQGVGSGVIIDKSGLVLTNNHVVEGADEVTVRLADGREFKATDIKTDPQSDLAVLRIKSNETFPAAKLGDSDKLDIGDWVIAIGTPFDLDQTVSAGIISAKGREMHSRGKGGSKMLQTDAAINPGNSGGPLVNLDGEVIGINTAIATNTGSFEGIGFAIPSNQAKWITEQLVKDGSVHRAYLGISIGEIDQDLAEQFKLPRHGGVLVKEVFPGTPADEAGLKDGDVITTFSKSKVTNPRDLQEIVERAPLDSKQPMEILRDGKSKTLTVTAKAMPEKFGDNDRPARRAHHDEDSASPANFKVEDLGMEVTDLTPAEAETRGFKGYTGVLIANVDQDGVAYDKGLREGMLIRKIGKTEVKDLKSFQEALKKESLKEGVMLQVRTQNGNDFVVVKTT